MNKRMFMLAAILACVFFLTAAGPAAAGPIDGPVADSFWAIFGPDGALIDGGGTGWGSGAYFPYQFDGSPGGYDIIYNQWFYDHPTVIDYYKIIELYFVIDPIGPDAYAEVWLNWSTPEWSPNPDLPPLPGMDSFIDRELVYIFDNGVGTYYFQNPFIIAEYNPEWISIDLLGTNYFISGDIWHECLPQEPIVPIPGAVWLLGSGLLGLIGFRKKFVS